jgi:hypothetical protein
MSRCTHTEALRAFRMLRGVNAGRLRGQSLRYAHPGPVPAGSLHEPAAAQLQASLYRKPGTPAGPDAIVYVVVCDGTPIVWLTAAARVVTPAADLSAYQLRQQATAADALSRLSRRAIAVLAAWCDQQDGRPEGGTGAPGEYEGPHLLVANPATPTVTHWTRISPDPAASREHLRQVTGGSGPVLIVAAAGYGEYGTCAEVLDLDVLCVIEQLAGQSGAPAGIIGSWLHAEGGTRTAVTGRQVIDGFTRAYAGIHHTQRAYAAAERDARGWTAALTAAGIDVDLFDLDEFQRRLFDTDAHAIRLPDHRIAVFRKTGQRQDG